MFRRRNNVSSNDQVDEDEIEKKNEKLTTTRQWRDTCFRCYASRWIIVIRRWFAWMTKTRSIMVLKMVMKRWFTWMNCTMNIMRLMKRYWSMFYLWLTRAHICSWMKKMRKDLWILYDRSRIRKRTNQETSG